MHADAAHLDGNYAAFGMVTDGLDVVDRIATTATGANNRPVQDQTIRSIRVETFGETYAAQKIQ